MSGKFKKNVARTEKDMSAPKDTRAEKISEFKISVVATVIIGVLGWPSTFASNWVIQNSENAKRCDELEAAVRQKDAQLSEKGTLLAEKSERIADQRAEISLLKQTVLSKDIQLDVKQSTITS